MAKLRGGPVGWIETFGRVLQLAFVAFVWPFRWVVRWSWDKWLGNLLKTVADLVAPTPAEVRAAKVEDEVATEPAWTTEAEAEDGDGDGGSGGPAVSPAGSRFGAMSWRTTVVFLLVVAGIALVSIMRRIDSALQQMHGDRQPAGSALGFPVSFGDLGGSLKLESAQKTINNIHTGWNDYRTGVAGPTTLDSPYEIAHSLINLDAAFILLYSVVSIALLIALHRLNTRTVITSDLTLDEQLVGLRRRSRMVASSGVALALLFIVDVAEDIQLIRSLAGDESLFPLPGAIALGPLLSLLKIVLAVALLVPAAIVTITLAVRSQPLRSAVTSARGILYGVALLALLLNVGIGADQLDDVVRAWDGTRAIWAIVACAALSGTVAGATRRLTDVGVERLAPDTGCSAQPFVLGLGVLLVIAGVLLHALDLGWGLYVPGGLLIGLWALGLAFDELPDWPTSVGAAVSLPGRRTAGAAIAGGICTGAVARLLGDLSWLSAILLALLGAYVVLAGLAVWLLVKSPDELAAPPTEPGPPPEQANLVVTWGDRLGRFAGATVVAIVIVTIARATALDAYIKKPDWETLQAPVVAAIVLAAWGAFLSGYLPRRSAPGLWTILWVLCTVGPIAVGVFYLLPTANAITGAEYFGSMALLLGGFSAVLGLIGLLATVSRQGAFSRYMLPSALRVVQVKRFPVLLFIVAWALVVSVIDKGGYHDVRRLEDQPVAAAPTLYDAWQGFMTAKTTTSGARPVVLVAAQGGGIRAAVWTAIVMECLFGPGPVPDYEDACAPESSDPSLDAIAKQADLSLPVFLASGASGGSVGLAAWSARRADYFLDDAAAITPRTVEAAMDADFVASDVARMLVSDLPHALLAWDKPDRAEMLELSWEKAWQPDESPPVPSDRGLSRGLRSLWDTTHKERNWSTPVLALNGMSVEDDCRFLSSAVDFALPVEPGKPESAEAGSTMDAPDDAACRGPVRPKKPPTAYSDVLPSTNELIDYLCPTQDVPLSAAAHLSSRFPFESPTGRVERVDCHSGGLGLVPQGAVSFDADGGIFDNSGAGTAVDTWRALQPFAAQAEPAAGGYCIVPIFVQIDNSPAAVTVSPKPDPRPPELLAPVIATLGQVSSREAYARAGAASSFTRPVSAGGRPVYDKSGQHSPHSLWFRITLAGQPGPEPPLGWTLAPQTVNDMRSQLKAKANATEMSALRELLKPGGLTCEKTTTPAR